MFKRVTAAVVALTLGVALALVGATAAQAHTGDLGATYVCNTDGSATITYTLTTSAVPNDKNGHPLVGTTYWKVGTTTFEHTPTSLTPDLNLGPVSSTGNTTVTLGTYRTAIGATTEPWAYAWTTWPDKATKGSDGGDYALTGCGTSDAAASITVTPATCTSPSAASWTGLTNIASTTILSQATGPHTGTATATSGHIFSTTNLPSGVTVSSDKTKETISYTIAPKLTGDACLATVVLTSTPSCTASSVETATLSHATQVGTFSTNVGGPYTATFTAENGYHFSNNTGSLTLSYSITPAIGYQNTNSNAPCYQPVVVTPTFPEPTAPTCTTDGALPAAPANTASIVYSWNGLTLTATAQPGYIFAGNQSTASRTYTQPGTATGYQNTNPNAPCYRLVVVTPIFPEPTAPTCTANGSLPTLPANSSSIHYTWSDDGLTLTATAQPGYVFAGDQTVASRTYTQPGQATGYQNTNPNAPCYQLAVVTPSFPEPTAPTCTTDGALPATPANTASIVYSWNGLTLTATAQPGYEFDANGTTTASRTYTQPGAALGYQNTNPNAPCYQLAVVTPVFPEPTEPTCTADGALPTPPADSASIHYTWSADGLTLTATAQPGYEFDANGTTTASRTYTQPGTALGYQNTNPNAACYQLVLVTPVFPEPTEPTCTAAGALPTQPADSASIHYTWSADGLTLTATAQPGYEFDTNGTTTASRTYTQPGAALGYQNTNPNAPCYQLAVVTPTFPEPTEPTCTADGALPTQPADSASIHYTWSADGLTLTATAQPGYEFDTNGTTTASRTYTQPGAALGYQNTNPNAACYQLVDVTPSAGHTDQSCSVDSTLVGGTITLKIVTGITYLVTRDDDLSHTPIAFTVDPTDATQDITAALLPGAYTVTPSADAGYQLTSTATIPEVIKAYSDRCAVDASVTAKATSTDQTCQVVGNGSLLQDGVITVYLATGVDYTITSDADSTHTPIPYTTDATDATIAETAQLAPGDYTVTPVAQTGFVLSNPGDIPLTIAPYDGVCGQLVTHPLTVPAAVQTQIGCTTAGSYTMSDLQEDATSLPADGSSPAVIWTVNGSTVAEGTYTVSTAGHYVIDAAPGPDFGFAEGTKTHWVFDFATPADCSLTTLALTGTAPAGLLVVAGFLVLFGLALSRKAAQGRNTARS